MYQWVSQLFPPNGDLGSILQLIYFLAFFVYLFYAQRIQTMTMLRQVEGALIRLKTIRDEGRRVALKTVKEIGKPQEDPAPRIDQILEQFMITPVDLDPAGVVWRLEKVMNVRESRFEEDVKIIAPEANETETHNLENLLEAAMALNAIYKVIRHFYLLGKKTMNIYIIMQVQMVLPLLLQEVEAYSSALQAFAEGMPVGDGAGALTAAKLMRGHEWRLISNDTVVAEAPLEERSLLVVKAKGPGGGVGKLGDAVRNLIEEREGKISKIITIDAAGKLEGEETGSIAEGVGTAIGEGGIVDKYKIEEVSLKYNIPIYAIAIKEDIKDVVAPMKEAIVDGAEKAVEAVKRFVKERTKEGEVLIVVGVGNTVGIAQ
ncbi:MAG: DUF1512 family protein [Candidatus Bathyarchaeia archaeon]